MMTQRLQLSFQRLLQAEFETSKRRNAAISMRAFSKKVGMSPGTLSQVLSGKRQVSFKLLSSTVARLFPDPDEQSRVIEEMLASCAMPQESIQYRQLDAAHYYLLTDWVNFAILNLVGLKGFRTDYEWIARRLNITAREAQSACERLFKLGLLVETDGKWQRNEPKYETTRDIPNQWLVESHHRTLDLAHEKLDELPVDERYFSWVTFPMNSDTLAKAKDMIRDFQDELMAKTASLSEPDDVFRMAVQLFPLTSKEESKRGDLN